MSSQLGKQAPIHLKCGEEGLPKSFECKATKSNHHEGGVTFAGKKVSLCLTRKYQGQTEGGNRILRARSLARSAPTLDFNRARTNGKNSPRSLKVRQKRSNGREEGPFGDDNVSQLRLHGRRISAEGSRRAGWLAGWQTLAGYRWSIVVFESKAGGIQSSRLASVKTTTWPSRAKKSLRVHGGHALVHLRVWSRPPSPR